MRKIERTSAFRRDFKREMRGQYRGDIDPIVSGAIVLLSEDRILPHKYHDHELAGEWSDFRECHLKPDLLSIYRKYGTDALQLVRLGSHSELFG